ncbi:6,7-dimethyl-8-ribityllumazine synthase [Candidatus Peregrinibacteria bacterium]|nr:6,7-dimethyl-8-ribityllumazine synthase [Candidatus Peregrinibacteria bacterium]
MHIAIIVSQFNKKISDRLLAGAKKALKEAQIAEKHFRIIEVPGAFEISFAASKLAKSKKWNGIIALGCVLKGETDHYRAVCDGVVYGIQKVSIENRIPIMFGVLMCQTEKQALKRSGTNSQNKGYECVNGLMKLFYNF